MEDNRYFEGIIKFDDSVYEMLIALTALETHGVAGMSSTFGDNVVSLLGMKNKAEGVKIQHLDDGSLLISLYIVARYGYRIPDVALRLQERVKSRLVEETGADVKGVDIYVQGIDFDAEVLGKGMAHE